jgi:hypothetical protein
MNPIVSLLFALALVPTLTACESAQPLGPEPDPGSALVQERHALTRDGLGLDLVGVAVDPLTGARFVLDASNRLYDLKSEGALSLRLDLTKAWGDEPLQDICAVSDTEIFTVAPGFGLRVNLETESAQSHFCLEPGDPMSGEPEPWLELRHETHAIACDVEANLIYGQPQTLPRDEGDDTPIRSEVSLYDLPSGADVGWYPLPSELFIAGGMAVVGETLLLGRDSLLSSYDIWTGVLEPVLDLAPYGVDRIEGLAPDAERNALLVVDGEDSELLVLDLTVLAEAL